jgi:hypothetical protein
LTDLPSWTDKLSAWSSLASVVVALGGAVLVVLSIRQASAALRHQTTSSDLQSVLTIWERLDHHWCRFRQAERGSANQGFEFGQLTTYYEMACSLFNDKVLTTKATRTLEEHLSDILPIMYKNEEFIRLFEALQSDPNTFSNIRQFQAREQAGKSPGTQPSGVRQSRKAIARGNCHTC